MSVAQAHGVYRSMLRREKRTKILKQFPENVQCVWSEYLALGGSSYRPGSVGKFIMYLISILISVQLFLKGRKVGIDEVYNYFLLSFQDRNKKFEELSQRAEVKAVLKSFEEHNVAWDV